MRLTPISRTDLIKRFRLMGWEGPFSGGRHAHMVKSDIQVSIPNPHGSDDIGVNLLKLILSQAGISREEWLRRR